MNYVSFSLWGDKPIYNVGIVRNAELMKSIYPGWTMVVYYDDTVPIATIKELNNLGVIPKLVDNSKIYGMFWRFLAADISDCEYAIFRDADSRISIREKLAVDEWIKSGKTLHVMRDHPYHKIPAGNNELGILGGMWGIKSKIINLTKLIQESEISNIFFYGNDQRFLKKIYNLFIDDRCTHDDFFEKKNFPSPRIGGRFVGERIGDDENPYTKDFEIILHHEYLQQTKF